jgi:hypothetical protein
VSKKGVLVPNKIPEVIPEVISKVEKQLPEITVTLNRIRQNSQQVFPPPARVFQYELNSTLRDNIKYASGTIGIILFLSFL